MNPDHHHPLSPTMISNSISTSTTHSNTTNPNLNPKSNIIIDYPPQSPLQNLSLTNSTITLLPPSPISTTSPPSSNSNHSSPTHSTNSTTTHHSKSKQNPNHPIITNQNIHQDPQLFNHFSKQCKKMFYEADQNATKSVEQIIKQLPAASKAAFTKQMASIRSQFHRDAASSRRAEVDKLLLETLPSSLIIKSVGNDSSLSAMRSPRARQERKDRLQKFIMAHCVRNMVGVHPFFSSLCAVLHLLIIPARKGGSGKRRIEWDIDLALFCEAGGEPFLRDSIEFLKGVLGFEDHLKPLTAPSFVSSRLFDPDEDEDVPPDMIIGHSDGDDGLTLEERQELEVDEEIGLTSMESKEGTGRMTDEDEEGPFADLSSPSMEDEEFVRSAGSRKGKEVLFRRGTEGEGGRDRAISDPFSDPSPTNHNSPRITVSPAVEDTNPTAIGLGLIHHGSSGSTTPKALHSPQLNPLPLSNASTSSSTPVHKRSPTQNSLDAPPPTEIRTFRSPSYLSNPEIKELIECFPEFIRIKCKTARLNMNFANPSKGKNGSGSGSGGGKGGEIELEKMRKIEGHGLIKVSVFERDENWKGSLFERFRLFFFRVFGI
ncbi:uncharacterized protein MELLADRAFT_103218 [Melampsora larici-populina 98AG31]|uniref:Uncharacterized protein n=1 Tax=Melampsora larici-populina (strain 98AG31 / pathotype 3-4-7) TaxID=747676 RepID=F4RAY1_MELLP|nr:uncharacterized protein MELLADRAFT_103218 [Melampsora larici-populina 98AG31]EGG10554.1 hypothetical protein MELLADRAFT_103218 [Melampsora larici-populina 98AG31]